MDHGNFAKNVKEPKANIQPSSCKRWRITIKLYRIESSIFTIYNVVYFLCYGFGSDAVYNSLPPLCFDIRCFLQVLNGNDVAMATCNQVVDKADCEAQRDRWCAFSLNYEVQIPLLNMSPSVPEQTLCRKNQNVHQIARSGSRIVSQWNKFPFMMRNIFVGFRLETSFERSCQYHGSGENAEWDAS